MRKAHKIIYAGAAIFVVAAALAWIFALRDKTAELSHREINGFVLDENQPHDLELSQVVADGTGRDGVPALSQPKFVPIADAPTTDTTPGILVQNNGEQHFYPYNIIAWHQIVNDYIGGTPVVVTYSPQCDLPAAYKRLADDQSIWFGLSGLSYKDIMLLYDDATSSLWLQNSGKAVVGSRIGVQMESLQTEVIKWQEAKQKYPTAVSLSSETGFARDYQSGDYPGKNGIGSIEDECRQDVVQ